MEGPLPISKDEANPAKTAWAQKVYPLINQLEAAGITWAWVNDASIQEATLEKDGQLNIRGNHFQALILANDTVIQLQTAQQIKILANKDMKLLATGELPGKQPSFLNWKENDAKTEQAITSALKAKNSRYINDENELAGWIKQLNSSVAFQQPYHFTRQAQRDMNDGSRIEFIWNKRINGKTFRWYWIKIQKQLLDECRWGKITKNNGSTVSYQLAPYGSMILYASTKNNEVADNLIAPAITVDESKGYTVY